MILLVVYFLLFLISAWVVYNTFVDIPRRVAKKKLLLPDFAHSKHPEVAERLSKAITFRTVSYASGNTRVDEIEKLLEFLAEQFPLLHGGHELATVEKVNNYSRLYTIRGSDSKLKAYLLNAHIDVVPTENQQWTHDPFTAGIRDGFILGRGAVDDKNSALAIMESLSYLLQNGFKPKRTIYVAITHDEEVGGTGGAKVIADVLISRNVQLEFVHDEGTMVFKGIFQGIRKEVAMVSVSQKGYLDVQVSLNVGSASGHSAAAKPGLGVLGKLGGVACSAERYPMKLYLDDIDVETFRIIASEMPLSRRIAFRNMRLFWPLVRFLLKRAKSTGQFQTTSAVTMFNGGLKHNVVPSEGNFNINHRIHPQDSVARVIARDKALLNDPKMELTIIRQEEPHPIAPYDSTAIGYHVVKAAIEQSIGPETVVVVPGIMFAASDSRHFLRLTTACYRFLPTRIKPSEVSYYHGADERISLENYEETINFYVNLIRNADATSVDEIYSN